MENNDGYISYKKIISKIDLKKGDIVIVSSDILRLIYACRDNNEQFDPNIFIDSIIDKIGKKGTLLFPTYNWDYCKGKPFDYQNTISQTGYLSNVALKRKDFIRTKHPVYSHAVWGFDSEYLFNRKNKSGLGSDSEFAYLHNNKAKQLFIGDKESFWHTKAYTSVHYIEEKVKVKYRYMKKFTALYIDENGVEKSSSYNMYVRDLSFKDDYGNELSTQVDPRIASVLIQKKCYKKYFINNVYFGIINMQELGKILENDLRNEAKFFRFVNA